MTPLERINSKKNVSKIAIVNPYLQGGHVNIAETETANRFKQAGKNLSIDIQIFAKSEEVVEFDPNFVINITYQEGKLTQYPTYVSLNIPLFFLKNVPRFIRNILSCDGFLTVSSQVTDWLRSLCALHNKIPHISHTAFSVPKTEFKKCDFTKSVAAYIGTNWDGSRHNEIFNLMSDGKYLKCFGPTKSWTNYPRTLYGGEVPFDGTSLFEIYRNHAVGFCIGHPEFDKNGIANTRIFEIAAASALPISSNNSFTRDIYGDSALYLDQFQNAKEYAAQLTSMVTWARINPKIAQDMAQEAHRLFNMKASMEFYLTNLIEMHTNVMNINRFEYPASQDSFRFPTIKQGAEPNVVFIIKIDILDHYIKLLSDLDLQTYPHIEIVLIAADKLEIQKQLDEILPNFTKKIHYITNEQDDDYNLFILLKKIKANWLSILSVGDQVFPNHTAFLMDAYIRYISSGGRKNVAGILSKCLEYTNGDKYLPEVIQDEHTITTMNKVRIWNDSIKNRLLPSFMINFSKLNYQICDEIQLYGNKSPKLFSYIGNIKTMIVPEVTCATLINNDE